MGCLIVFETKGIQSWILEGGLLRDLVGGSEIIERLCTTVLDTVLTKLGDPSVERLKQAAGGFRLLFTDQEAADRLLRVWPQVVSEYAPGLRFVLVAMEESSGEERLRSLLSSAANKPFSQLPPIPPLVQRSGRTGGPVTRIDEEKEELERIGRGVDPATARKRAISKSVSSRSDGSLANKLLLNPETGERLADDFTPPDVGKITAGGGNRTLAVIHADGNAIGELFLHWGERLKEHPQRVSILRQLSKLLAESTASAARAALQAVIKPIEKKNGKILPARPVVLGGDDITFITRAADAIPFANTFLLQFASETARRLQAWPEFPPEMREITLTASAGIACVHEHYPFQQAYALSEQLCAWSKQESGRQASTLAFHRVTGSMTNHYTAVLERELTVPVQSERLLLTMGPYRVGSSGEPRLANLDALRQAVAELPSGSWRELVTLAHEGSGEALLRFQRLEETAEGNNKEPMRKLWEALQNLGCAKNDFRTPAKDNLRKTPIGDAEAWLGMEREISS